jgi:hypothetical protein
MGLNDYLVIYGTAWITEGGAAELRQRLARTYPDVRFPPTDNPPPGYITHIGVEPRLPTLVFRRWVGRVGGGAGSGPDQCVDGEERDLWRRVPGLLRGGQELLAGEVLELLL